MNVVAGGGTGAGGDGGFVYSSDATRGRCERHLLSKSVSHAILHDNSSLERLLDCSISYLDREKTKSRLLMESTMKAFRARQLRKQGNWKREDEARLNCLNAPHVGPAAARSPGVLRLYTSPRYAADDDASRVYVPLRPVVCVRRPQLEVLLAGGEHRILLSRLPSAAPVDARQLRRYDRYRGKRFLERAVVDGDARLANLLASLAPSAAAPPPELLRALLPPIRPHEHRLSLPARPGPPLLPAGYAAACSEAASRRPSRSRSFSLASREETRAGSHGRASSL